MTQGKELVKFFGKNTIDLLAWELELSSFSTSVAGEIHSTINFENKYFDFCILLSIHVSSIGSCSLLRCSVQGTKKYTPCLGVYISLLQLKIIGIWLDTCQVLKLS